MQRILGRHASSYQLLGAAEVLAFQAQGQLVWVITASHKFASMGSLRTIETRLNGMPFLRVRRDAIVNVAHVKKINLAGRQRMVLTLSNAHKVVVSKRMVHTVRQTLMRG